MDSWVIPCNPKWYDVFGAFQCLETIDWRQTVKNIEVGDTVYIYAGKPIQAITHKCIVLKTDIPDNEADDEDERFSLNRENEDSLNPYPRYMRLKLVRSYDPDILPYSKLVDYGLVGSIQGQRRTGPYIQEAIDSVD